MEGLFEGISSFQLAALILSLLIACGFEFVNGFHDTANAVATVIYTRTLHAWPAVILSGICNFFGVFIGGIAVAISIINLLPAELLVSKGASGGLAMVFALLLAAMLWNLGTWYLGLPASSSHTLIGAILGIGIANSLLPGHTFGEGVNWSKASEVGLSLLISPLFGFTVAGLLLMLAKKLVPNPELYKEPKGESRPPLWIRAILISTCSGVSFAHGSNDGQKGVGLIMLILIGIIPGSFAVNLSLETAQIEKCVKASDRLQTLLQNAIVSEAETKPLIASAVPMVGTSQLAVVEQELAEVRSVLEGKTSLRELSKDARWTLRKDIILIDTTLSKMEKSGSLTLSTQELAEVKRLRGELRKITDYAPLWVLVIVAVSLGVGTTIGWKRIVITVGEKIGKSHLTYAQGAAAEIVAMSTIGVSALAGLPVSTTHVLSSGVAGTMVAQGSGIQSSTVKKIAMAWILTLPMSMLLSGCLFLLIRLFL
ncbi:MAG: inorganic phosphate transporter [Acidobacteriota bacterium]|nr:inorganic phosphate transporter [Blastocatellia bacterium]MDW8413291.1 inorganic phosphate transporter [Acidobacteriota bacterium]